MPKKPSKNIDQPNVITLLTADHEKIKQLCLDFEQLDADADDDESKRALVTQACAELTIHAEIEEEFFYPALRDLLDEQDLLDQAQVEHDMAKKLIAELESMEPEEDLYDAKFKVLCEYVQHHIEQEQEKIFPKAKKSKLDLEALAMDMMQRKAQLQEEFGLQDEEENESLGFARPAVHKKPGRHPRA